MLATSGCRAAVANIHRTRSVLSLLVVELTRHFDKSSPYGPANDPGLGMIAHRITIAISRTWLTVILAPPRNLPPNAPAKLRRARCDSKPPPTSRAPTASAGC